VDNRHWETVHGWFDYANIYDDAVSKAKNGDTFVEVGTWMGKSTCYLAQKLKDKGVNITFYACDLFLTPDLSTGSWSDGLITLTEPNFKNLFVDNLRKQGVDDFVSVVEAHALDFVKQFDADRVDFLFLDNDHRPEHVIQELFLWYPRMKKGSIMAGHDVYDVQKALDAFKIVHGGWNYRIDGNSWISEIK